MNLSTMLFSFAGRINRARYWLTGLAAGVVAMPVVVGIAVGIGRAYLLAIAIAVAVFLALIWINLALSIKRLYDRDKSAWWLLLFYGVPSILPALDWVTFDRRIPGLSQRWHQHLGVRRNWVLARDGGAEQLWPRPATGSVVDGVGSSS